MKKRLLALTCFAVMGVSLLACGKDTKTSASDSQTSTSAEESKVAESSVTTDESGSSESTSSAESSSSIEESSTSESSSSTKESSTPESSSIPESSSSTDSSEPAEKEKAFKYNTHPYVSIIDEKDVPKEYWDAFYNLCDAIHTGESTFECASAEAYDWAISPSTLNLLCPVAVTKIKGESNDGTTPFENGVGRIYYQMPVDDYLKRQADFETSIEELLNSILEADDCDFEKVFKIYDYISRNYVYQDDFVEDKGDGAVYVTINTKTGQCIDLAGVYSFLLYQLGIDNLRLGCNNETMAHEWIYVVLDGKGYHSDVTWSLYNPENDEQLLLRYFLMTGKVREDTGCAVDDLTVGLLPKYWVNNSETKVVADDESFVVPGCTYFVSLDEENHILHYTLEEAPGEMKY